MRRFRECYLEVARKNGKSMTAALIGIMMFALDGEAAAEVYSGATTEKQAWETFGPARQMLLRSEEIAEELGIQVNARSITGPDGSKFEPIIGNPGDGSSPSCAIIDEYHEHATSALFDTMITGMGSREQPLALAITTSGYDLSGPCYDKHLEAKRVLDGAAENEALFAIIFSIDDNDDWTSPKILAKANPNIGVSIDEEFLRSQQRQATINAEQQNRFKTKHLNVWCSARSAWMNLQAWQACGDTALSIEDFAGDEAWFGLDLASKIDLCASVQLFKRRSNDIDHLYAFARFYAPEESLRDPQNGASYRKWAVSGHLTITDGAETDFDIVRDDCLALASKFTVREIGYDPWRATQLAHQLEKEGATVVEIRQNAGNLSAPMKEIEGAVRAGRFHHDANPVLTWCIANVVSKEDAKQNVFPVRPKPHLKIDGALALIMAVSRAVVVEVAEEPEIFRL